MWSNYSAADDTDDADIIFFSANDKDMYGRSPFKKSVLSVSSAAEKSTHTHKFPFCYYLSFFYYHPSAWRQAVFTLNSHCGIGR